MLEYVEKNIIKYLIILILTFMIGMGLFFVMHIFLDKKVEKYSKELTLILNKQKILNDITNNILSLKAYIFEETAGTQNSQQRNTLNKKIEKNIQEVIFLAKKLNSDFENFENFFLELETIKQKNKNLLKLLDQRDLALIEDTSSLVYIAKEVRKHNYLVPERIDNLLQYVTRTQISLIDKKHQAKIVRNQERKKYLFLEIYASIIIFIITLVLSKLIIKHIIKLYHELETKLYVDDLTQLQNRFALEKNYQDSEKPFMIIIDIDLFREINELYGIKIGNKVLKRLSIVMSKYFSNTNFGLYRISGDEFVLFDDNVEYSYEQVKKIILDFLHFIKVNKINISELGESIELDFTCGVSSSKENIFAKADIALNHAKKNDLQFAMYKKSIDNKVELKHNLFWNKEIQKGINLDMFMPFFQPIVDRNGEIKKYEALMRLKKVDNKDVSYIVPFKFLDIAKKTKNYNKISFMTIFKSLDMCHKTGCIISINLDKKDMDNIVLKNALKQKIIELDIAKRIVFEILESENVIDNEKIKEFISDFRSLGVKFAIDDFGSGYSNFSFILNIRPDCIKIDGSLVKNIAENNDSYELVKSIVVFAKALNIITIAEFVHSKEVYEIGLDLGIDQFQGYYFGEPKDKCQ